ncbi:hypothetical protein Tco_0158853 [Tanacetum coccineum]
MLKSPKVSRAFMGSRLGGGVFVCRGFSMPEGWRLVKMMSESRAEGAKKHVAALHQLMMDIVSNPMSSLTWVGETSTSAAPLSTRTLMIEDKGDEALGSVLPSQV